MDGAANALLDMSQAGPGSARRVSLGRGSSVQAVQHAQLLACCTSRQPRLWAYCILTTLVDFGSRTRRVGWICSRAWG